MITSEFVSSVALAATGKEPTYATGTTKWLKIVAIGNRKLRQWAREPGVNWASLYDPEFPIGTVTANQTFDLEDDIRKISQREGDFVRIYRATDITQFTDYTTTSPDKLKDYTSGYVTQVGRTLRFTSAFTSSDPLFGGTIYAPVYLYPDTFANDNDDIIIDNPDWLVVITAAELVRNDITRKSEFGNLIAEANDLMEGMKQDNDAQDTTIGRSWNPMGHLQEDTW